MLVTAEYVPAASEEKAYVMYGSQIYICIIKHMNAQLLSALSDHMPVWSDTTCTFPALVICGQGFHPFFESSGWFICSIMWWLLCCPSDVSMCVLSFQKDNGGPLVCQEHERKVIIGVSIQRTKCASSQPALFVNVAFYSEWIYKVFKLYPS